MDFSEKIKQFSKDVSKRKGNAFTEEATKMSLIVPFFQMLGYDVFDSLEFCPEYVADVGIKKGEKVDYAILNEEHPVILIECKSCLEALDKHSSQLFRYFATTRAKFGILTNGLIYKFYTDLEESNKMDLEPFLEINMESIKDSQICELKKFCKTDFDKEKIFSTASELKYNALAKEVLAGELDSPSDDFTRFILSKIYEKQKTQKIIDQFKPIIKKSFTGFINEIVNHKISSALTEDAATVDVVEETAPVEESKIITTSEEIEAFYIIRGILAGSIPIEDVVHRDTESYFGILYKDNNRKPICRIDLNHRIKSVAIPDENKKFTKYILNSLTDLYNYKELIISTAARYHNGEEK